MLRKPCVHTKLYAILRSVQVPGLTIARSPMDIVYFATSSHMKNGKGLNTPGTLTLQVMLPSSPLLDAQLA
jgi:hypothetical protein